MNKQIVLSDPIVTETIKMVRIIFYLMSLSGIVVWHFTPGLLGNQLNMLLPIAGFVALLSFAVPSFLLQAQKVC